MEFRILGPLEVRRDGVPVDPGGPKQRALLIRLLVAAGRVVSVDRLIDDVWAGEPPAGAVGTLQSYVSNLRRVLEPGRAAGAPAAVLVTSAPGYRLIVDDSDVDAAEFERLVAEARTVLGAGDAAAAESVLGAALPLWRGEALAEMAGEPWAVAEASRMEELRQAAIETVSKRCSHWVAPARRWPSSKRW